MNPDDSSSQRWRLHLSLTDILFLALGCVLLLLQIEAFLAGAWPILLLVIRQILTLGCILFHRPASEQLDAAHPGTMLAWIGTLMPGAMQPAESPAVEWVMVGVVLGMIGNGIVIASLLSLGRSLGMEAANRGIQTGGMYRWVRHPIYAAYVPVIGGSLIIYPSLLNIGISIIWMAAQIGRIQVEERMLQSDETYYRYQQQVRYRLIPGIW